MLCRIEPGTDGALAQALSLRTGKCDRCMAQQVRRASCGAKEHSFIGKRGMLPSTEFQHVSAFEASWDDGRTWYSCTGVSVGDETLQIEVEKAIEIQDGNQMSTDEGSESGETEDLIIRQCEWIRIGDDRF